MFYYNLLKNARIKSITTGLILILLNIILFSLFYARVTLYPMLFLTLPSIILLFLFSYLPFGQALEKTNPQQFLTFYALGKFRWNVKTFEGPLRISIDQDKDRYYYLIVEHVHGKLSLERHPVLSTANERLEELKAHFPSFIR